MLVFGASLRAESLNRTLGAIADPELRARFEKSLQAFLSLAEAAKHYPCIKRAWVEFLGGPPGAGVDRVDPVSQGARGRPAPRRDGEGRETPARHS